MKDKWFIEFTGNCKGDASQLSEHKGKHFLILKDWIQFCVWCNYKRWIGLL